MGNNAFQEFDLSQENFDEDTIILHFSGNLTGESEPILSSYYANHIKPSTMRTLICNFEHTHYINSAGIAGLLSMVTELSERRIEIRFVSMNRHIQKVMNIVGLSDFVILEESQRD